MSEIEQLIAKAAIEYKSNGMVNVSLIMELTSKGIDYDTLQKTFEDNQ